jgi:hypothetical protein
MLHEALSQQPLRWAVTSHAIRRINTPGSAPHKVTQAWLQSVWVNTKLPNPQEQADTFLQYLGTADVASSDWVRCYPQHLSGLLGTADDPTRGETSGFTYVVDHMKDKDLIEQPGPTQLPADDGAMNYRLSFSGWARFDELRRQPGGQ